LRIDRDIPGSKESVWGFLLGLCMKKELGLVVTLVATLIMFWESPCQPAEEFTDALGRVVRVESPPQRIVSLAPSLTEILYALGLGDRVAGVTQFSYYPPEARGKPKVGSYVNLSVEKIISLNPDMVIGTVDGNEPGVVRLLEQAGIHVYIVNPRTVREAIGTIAEIGALCGVRKRAQALSKGLALRVDRVSKKVAGRRRPLVFLQINISPIMTVNGHTIHHDVIRLAGGENMTEKAPMTYPRINLEEVIQRRPEVIIISSMERGGRFERARKAWLEWPSIPAARTGRIHMVDSDLLDRPSPRIVKGLEIMARLIHPEVGWEEDLHGNPSR
jgi:iron complex transport system substrate-binding protein